LINEYRAKLKLSYNYDDILATLLSTALSNYEIERVTGSTFCEEEFQFAIKNYIPPKHTFKAFPIQLTTLDPKEILAQLLEQQKAKEILQTKGESLFFAIRTKLVIFPDNIFALWLSLAVRYYRLD
jgi:centrosomal protein CEP76